MYKVVIVDDERPIVEGLKAFIDWEEQGFSVVGTAFNGEDGVKAAKECAADVVITDIRMPLLSGHDLIDRVKEFNPSCKFIILSGYSNFKYAQEAVKRGAFSYLLKPIQERELKETLSSIKKELDLKKEKQRQFFELQEQVQESIPIVQERYLSELLQDQFATSEQIARKWRLLNSEYSLESFAVFVVEGDQLEIKYEDDTKQIFLSKYAISNIVDDLVRRENIGMVFHYDKNRIAVLCCQNGKKTLTMERVLLFARSIQGTICGILKESVSIGVGNLYSFPVPPYRSFQEAEQAIRYKLLYSTGSLICFYEICQLKHPGKFPVQQEKELLSFIELEDSENALIVLHRIFSSLTADRSCSPEAIYNICLNFIIAIFHCAISCGVSSESLNIELWTSSERLFQYQTIPELEKCLKERVSEVIKKIHEVRLQKQKGILGKILEYIQIHYQEELTLDFLSKMFFLNSSYLSQLFKKELGRNFSDVLSEIRLEKAKKLILDPDLRVYEVGELVGYRNFRYFSQIFKKNTGLTPSEYRKKVLDKPDSL